MKKLSPEAVRVIARGRADDPTLDDRERVRKKLAAALAMSAAVTAAATGGRALAAAWAPKVLVAVALAASGVALLAALHHQPAPGPPPGPAAPVAPPPAALVEPVGPPAPPAVQVRPAPVRRGAPVVLRVPTRVEEPGPAPVPSALAAPPEDALVAETNALREAHAELRAGHGAKALQLLDEQLLRFRGGTLEQERVATRVLALCQLGLRAEAQEALAALERTFPASPLLSRVRAACASP